MLTILSMNVSLTIFVVGEFYFTAFRCSRGNFTDILA